MEPLALEEGPVDFIRTSLERCAGHVHQNAKTRDFLPTRLIDVTGEFPRIVKPSTSSPEEPPPHDRRYLALSYCWGGQSQLLLTRESEQEFHTGLPREKLSPTQRDTIALAKALSIPYVWIDALCIRQNDRKDWESEAPVMGEIYSGAYLTVCAASSSSAQEGYLDREFVTPITVPVDPVSDPSGSIGGTYVFEPIMWLHDLNFTYNECGQFSLSSSDWATRAWTHQEMKMSTRLLYFTTSGMHFNCGQYIDSEYPYHIRLPDPATFMDDATTIYDRVGLESLYELSDTYDIYLEWTRRVTVKHGGRNMTEPTDAFPSLSGLANIFASLLQDDYVAGLWRKSLLSGLTWCTENPAHNSLESLFPSWSWVAHGRIRAGVQLTWDVPHPRDFTNECEDLKAVWALKTTDPCGELKSASLRIRTRVYSFQHGCLPYGLAYKLQQGTKRGNVYLSFDFRDADYEDLKLRDEWKDFVLILVATYRYPHNHTQPWPLGLIACPAYDGVRYIRIGRFHGYNDDLGELFKQCDVKDIEIV
ncbi:hypothetical protein PG989_004287 [Apiospora arundinis]